MNTENDISGSVKTGYFLKYAPAVLITAMTALFFAVLITFFDLSPHVGANFFFSSDNPKYKENQLLLKMFPNQSSLVVISAAGDLKSNAYIAAISSLSEDLLKIPKVSDVKSLTRGPGSLENAVNSPLWKRILISEEQKSSHIILLMKDVDPARIVKEIESVIEPYRSERFNLRISGIPYIVEMIRRNLFFDLKVFSSLACLIFGIMIILMFRSMAILIGTLVSCINACTITLIVSHLAGVKIGILTANIFTIIFVLTLSHIVFLTHNWQEIRRENDEEKEDRETLTRKAVKITFSASFWCMVTTFLGFLSLLFVYARPLKELGISGSIGTVCAIAVVYMFYPFFLNIASPPDHHMSKKAFAGGLRDFLFKKSTLIALGAVILTLSVIPGISKINTDPSLFAYFKKGSSLREGLVYIDKNGGSTPLNMVLRDIKGDKLTTSDNYNRLWELQRSLESDASVGSILSLPILLAEGKRYTLGKLLTLEGLSTILELPFFGSISRSFITSDRISTHFLLRMKESDRSGKRAEIIGRLRKTVTEHGFIPEIIGGLYLLQSELSDLVRNSIILGLGRLILFFYFIAVIITRSFKLSLAMIVAVIMIPVAIFGFVGLFKVPVDLISAPAANIAIAMGIDSMIHIVIRVRRKSKGKISTDREFWLKVRENMWNPIIYAMLIICTGFAIFSLSSFPPTNRFGIEIVFGTFMAGMVSLFVMPFVLMLLSPRKRKV
jgi:predicted RND superfamily exporter protein